MGKINMTKCKYQKGASKYKYVRLWVSPKGEKIWVAMICGVTRQFNTEREAAIYIDKALIRMGKEPINIMVRKQI